MDVGNFWVISFLPQCMLIVLFQPLIIKCCVPHCCTVAVLDIWWYQVYDALFMTSFLSQCLWESPTGHMSTGRHLSVDRVWLALNPRHTFAFPSAIVMRCAIKRITSDTNCANMLTSSRNFLNENIQKDLINVSICFYDILVVIVIMFLNL